MNACFLEDPREATEAVWTRAGVFGRAGLQVHAQGLSPISFVVIFRNVPPTQACRCKHPPHRWSGGPPSVSNA